jgi:hypothetical protein
MIGDFLTLGYQTTAALRLQGRRPFSFLFTLISKATDFAILAFWLHINLTFPNKTIFGLSNG